MSHTGCGSLTSEELESTLFTSKYTAGDFARVHTDSQGQFISTLSKGVRQTINDLIKFVQTVTCELGHDHGMVRLCVGEASLKKASTTIAKIVVRHGHRVSKKHEVHSFVRFL